MEQDKAIYLYFYEQGYFEMEKLYDVVIEEGKSFYKDKGKFCYCKITK